MSFNLVATALLLVGMPLALSVPGYSAEPTNPDGPLGSAVLSIDLRPIVSGGVWDSDSKVANASGFELSADVALPLTPRLTLSAGFEGMRVDSDYTATRQTITQSLGQIHIGARLVIGGKH